MTTQPIFLLSLPRSGSTLLQRVLASHPSVETVSEPWLLLPLLYSLRPEGVLSVYHHWAAQRAIKDFIATLPGGEEDYRRELREMITRLYSSVAGGARYMVDKTPRYHLIADDLKATFPDARFVLLWRNPLAVAASMISTWGGGRWNLHRWRIDLYDGVEGLCAFQESETDIHIVRYEDLVGRPEQVIDQLCGRLDIDYEPSMIHDFEQVDLRGRMGDPIGVQEYDRIDSEPLDKWPATFANPIRRHWAHRYLSWIGGDRLRQMGYDEEELLTELHSVPTSLTYLASDVVGRSKEWLAPLVEPRLARDKLRRLRHHHRIHTHE